MTYHKFGDLLFMTISSLIIILLILATIYTSRAVMSEAAGKGPNDKNLVRKVLLTYTDFDQGVATPRPTPESYGGNRAGRR
jgi:hypothetical protein